MHIKWQIHLRMGINAFHLVLFFVLKCVNVGFYILYGTPYNSAMCVVWTVGFYQVVAKRATLPFEVYCKIIKLIFNPISTSQ